jgi:hypothetical protein
MGRHSAPTMLPPRELPYPDVYAVPAGTVGSEVVALSDLVDWHGSHEGDLHARLFAEKYEAELRPLLDREREGLSRETPEAKRRLATYVQMLLSDRLPESDAQDPTLVDRLAAAQDEIFISFFRRHVGILAEQQKDGAPLIKHYDQQYVDNVYKGIAADWISADAYGVRKTVPQTQVEITDYWATHRRGITGLYHRDRPRIEIPQGLGHSRQERYQHLVRQMDHAFDHEQNHSEFGAKLPDWLEWFDEGMSEHVRLAMRFGQPEVLNPGARERHDVGGYRGFRSLIYFATECAPGGYIEPKYVTKGFTSRSLESKDWQAMERQFNEKWGVEDFLRPVSSRVAAYRHRLLAEHPDWNWHTVQDDAARLTKNDLDVDPRLIFGEDYKKPQPRVGTAALAGSVE